MIENFHSHQAEFALRNFEGANLSITQQVDNSKFSLR